MFVSTEAPAGKKIISMERSLLMHFAATVVSSTGQNIFNIMVDQNLAVVSLLSPYFNAANTFYKIYQNFDVKSTAKCAQIIMKKINKFSKQTIDIFFHLLTAYF